MSPLLTSLALASSVAAAICLYLGAPRQQWLTRAWPTRFSTRTGSILMLTAFGLWAWERTPATAFFSLLTVEMGIFAALPFLAPLHKRIPRYSGMDERFLLDFRSRLPSSSSLRPVALKGRVHQWLNGPATCITTVAGSIRAVFSDLFVKFRSRPPSPLFQRGALEFGNQQRLPGWAVKRGLPERLHASVRAGRAAFRFAQAMAVKASARLVRRWPLASAPQKAAAAQGIQRDWLSKALAGVLLGFSLAMTLSGIVAWLGPDGPAATNKFQWVMWLVSPLWLGVLSFCWLFRSGRHAWLQLGAANLLAFVGLYFSRYLSSV